MHTLAFSEVIHASREHVWKTMLDLESYKIWTSAFCGGSYYEGSWNEGDRIRFLSPDGGGMISVIAASRPAEYLSIKHLGFVSGGVDDVTSDAVRAWAPAFENYTFVPLASGMRLDISVEVLDEYVDYMNDAFPKALQKLKALCESARR